MPHKRRGKQAKEERRLKAEQRPHVEGWWPAWYERLDPYRLGWLVAIGEYVGGVDGGQCRGSAKQPNL